MFGGSARGGCVRRLRGAKRRLTGAFDPPPPRRPIPACRPRWQIRHAAALLRAILRLLGATGPYSSDRPAGCPRASPARAPFMAPAVTHAAPHTHDHYFTGLAQSAAASKDDRHSPAARPRGPRPLQRQGEGFCMSVCLSGVTAGARSHAWGVARDPPTRPRRAARCQQPRGPICRCFKQ